MLEFKIFGTAVLTNEFLRGYIDHICTNNQVDYSVEVVDRAKDIVGHDIASIPAIQVAGKVWVLSSEKQPDAEVRRIMRSVLQNGSSSSIPEMVTGIQGKDIDLDLLFFTYRYCSDARCNMRLQCHDIMMDDVVDIIESLENRTLENFSEKPLIFFGEHDSDSSEAYEKGSSIHISKGKRRTSVFLVDEHTFQVSEQQFFNPIRRVLFTEGAYNSRYSELVKRLVSFQDIPYVVVNDEVSSIPNDVDLVVSHSSDRLAEIVL